MKNPARMMSLAAALLLTIALTACGTANAPAPEPGDVPANTTEEPPADPAPDDTAQTEDPADTEQEAISATGEYNGQADPHTIEVNLDGTPTSFQLADGVAAQLEGLNEGDTISFEYIEVPVEGSDVPQLEIRSLTRADSATTGSGGNGSEGAAASESDRPATETFTVGDGEPETLTGKLEQGDGYSLYVWENYTFDAAGNTLSMTDDPTYAATIEPIPAGFNLDELRKSGTVELEQAGGEVQEFAGDTLFESPMANASLFLQGSSSDEVRDYIVWEAQDGTAYIFRLTMPESEEGSPFYTHATASLATIMGE